MQDRKVAEVTPWQSVVNFLDLRDDDVKIVEQPFARRIDVDRALLQADVSMRLAQYGDVLAQPRKERTG